MPSFTHNSFVCRAETIEMSSILSQRGCSQSLFPVSLYDESIASLATVQESACEVRRLKILWKTLQRGREARPPSNYNMDMILTAM